MSLFNDPISWSQSAVASWPRFWSQCGERDSNAIRASPRRDLSWLVSCLGVSGISRQYQCAFLYALRRLLPAASRSRDPGGVA